MTPIARFVHPIETKARNVAVRSPRIRQLAYSFKNRRLFADLSQHDRMLADRVRTDAYHDAFREHIGPDDIVVDLGTGSGVLSFLAARAGARQVHAIEHGPIIAGAEAVARANGIDNVTFHRMHSSAFELPGGADVIIHEQIGEALFDERVIENVADLRARVLKPGGRILPALLRLYVEPVQIPDEVRAPFAWEQTVHGVDFAALAEFGDTQPSSYRQPRFRPFPFERFLCEPEPVIAVDLRDVVPEDLPTTISYERPVTVDGAVDGLCVYFSAGFDEDRWFTSSPDGPPTSWGSPLLRTERLPVEVGDTIVVSITAIDLAHPGSWSWEVASRRG